MFVEPGGNDATNGKLSRRDSQKRRDSARPTKHKSKEAPSCRRQPRIHPSGVDATRCVVTTRCASRRALESVLFPSPTFIMTPRLSLRPRSWNVGRRLPSNPQPNPLKMTDERWRCRKQDRHMLRLLTHAWSKLEITPSASHRHGGPLGPAGSAAAGSLTRAGSVQST